MEFAKHHPDGEINLIVLDIAEHLKDDLMRDTQRHIGNPKFQHLFFYKINLAVSDDVEKLWEKIVQKHGPIHILVNNAAICQGKLLEQLTIQHFKLTMDINFISYVHMIMLFLKQKVVQNA